MSFKQLKTLNSSKSKGELWRHGAAYNAGLGGKNTWVSLQNKPLLGLEFHHPEDYNCQDAASRLLFCGACENAISPRCPELTICDTILLLKRRHFTAKSGFCTQGKMFAVSFKQWKPTAKSRARGALGSQGAALL